MSKKSQTVMFEYQGRSSAGTIVSGDMEGSSSAIIASQLMSTGVTPIRIAPKEKAKDNASISLKHFLQYRRAPDLGEMIMFSRQMYTLLRAGVAINQAINGIVRSIRNDYFAEVLTEIQAALESGQDLSQTIVKYPTIFPPLFVAMIQVGEDTGQLDEAFLQISHYMEHDKETRMRIKSAVRYPSFVLIAISVAITVINILVIPAFEQVFASAGTELPLPTRILMMTSHVFVNYWPFLLGGLVLFVFGIKMWLRTASGRHTWDRWKLKLPLVGDIIERALLSRFARAFAMSTKAGVPLIRALTVVARAVDNDYVAVQITRIRNDVEKGDTLTRSATATGMFTPLVLQMLSVGEETGAVDELLQEVAEFYEREVEYDIKNLSSTIEPVLITVIGVMVLMLALGIFLPMWDMSAIASA